MSSNISSFKLKKNFNNWVEQNNKFEIDLVQKNKLLKKWRDRDREKKKKKRLCLKTDYSIDKLMIDWININTV